MRLGALALSAALGATSCGEADTTRLDVRTTLPEALRSEVEASFESAHPEIDVRFSTAPADESAASLRAGDAGFDVWWGAPALLLERAANRGLLEPHGPGWDDRSVEARDARWHPILSTPLVIAFDRTVVALADAPSDWIDLLHHAWYQDVRILDPGGTDAGAWLVGATIVEALRDDDDLNRGFDWLTRLHRQIDAYAADPAALVRALERGDALVVVMPRAEAEAARSGDDRWLHYRIPESGTPELLLGVGIVAGTEVPDAARAFVDHLGTAPVATAAKLHTHWEPTAGSVDPSGLPADFELEQRWTAYTPALDTLAAELAGWLERWEAEVRTR